MRMLKGVIGEQPAERFRAAVAARAQGQSSSLEELRSASRAIAAEARERGASVEQMLIQLKELWDSVAGQRGSDSSADLARARETAITAAIKGYFA